jgi:VWFA-related protein
MSTRRSCCSPEPGARIARGRWIALALIAAGQLVYAQDQQIRGKVVMADGSPLPKPAQIERSCGGRVPVHIASTNAKGEFTWLEAGHTFSQGGECIWRAVLKGYDSSILDMEDIQRSTNVPDFVLSHAGEEIPFEAATVWNRASAALKAGRCADAEADLRALSNQYRQAGPIWAQLGFSLACLERLPEARQAYERAIQAAPWYLLAYHHLAVLDLNAEDYPSASKTLDAALKKGSSARIYLDQAEVRYNQRRPDAEHSALQAIALDTKRELPRAEYVLGLILMGGEDKAGAAAHLRRFLEIAPGAPEAADARARLRRLESADRDAEAAEAQLAPEGPSADPSLEADANGEAGVPGGLKGLAATARLDRTPAAKDFFREYCRAIMLESMYAGRNDISDFTQTLQAYLGAVLELSRMAGGNARPEAGEPGQIVLSAATVADYAATADVMKLFGWRKSPKGIEGFEPSELAEDSSRQLLPRMLGLDETEMFRSLADHGAFRIEIRNDRAPLAEAHALRAYAGKLPPGGYAELFLRNPRLAMAYVGLASMNSQAAAALTSSVGLRVLVSRYAELISSFGEAFAVENGRAVVPGGAAAEPVWQGLAGVGVADPKKFFLALLDKDQGRLAAFYWAVSRGDEAHQRFFTRAAAAGRYYDWYRNSPELRGERFAMSRPGWRPALFRDFPLDGAGNPYYPGGKAAWIDPARPDDEALLASPALEWLPRVAAIERARKAPFDAESAGLLSKRFSTWRGLAPYFEELPALGAAEFQALAAFETLVLSRPSGARNAIMGEWHALVKLIELGMRSGVLDAAAGARAFRSVCESLAAPDHAAGALTALRSFAPGGGDLEEAVKTGLLRMDESRREAFQQIREFQGLPSLAAPGLKGDAVMAALSGAVYAALLDPGLLLVTDDPKLVARHAFAAAPGRQGLFADTALVRQNRAPGSFFAGGFMTFEEAAKGLPRAGTAAPPAENRAAAVTAAVAAAMPPAPAAHGPATPPSDGSYVFRTSARLVEVSATVMDAAGNYADDLKREDFRIVDAGVPVQLSAFENHSSGISVALLLDTTGSMVSTLPALRSSALRLIEDLRPVDWVAVYGFNTQVSELQAFTRNRELAKRSILRTHAAGSTGLYDALLRVSHDLSGRTGKKAIVVFTDGEDNASVLTAEIAINRAKREGVPIYTIAHGGGIADARTGELSGMADSTGALSFAIREPNEIRGVFEHIARDLVHGYLLTFQPPPDTQGKWRPIKVNLPNIENRYVRARQGYYPE